MQKRFANDRMTEEITCALRGLLCSPRNLSLLGMLVVLTGMAGPFGTYEAYSAPTRYLFWLLMVSGTVLVGQAAGTVSEHLAGRIATTGPTKLLAAALLTTLPVFTVVIFILLAFGARPDPGDLMSILMQCGVVVLAASYFSSPSPETTAAREADIAPPLLSRLPTAKRGRLIQLAAQDHYVEVVTTKGNTLLPMRFRDAVAETISEPGLQVHRSHWVAIDAVANRDRMNDRPALKLSNGSTVPIGRTFKSAVREQGLI
ncbi:MAG: LytTR family DNA-binding domain-containing protein [Stappiaceae bacterium]